MQIKKVGVMGCGLMGHGMAKNILEAGYPLTIMGHKNRKRKQAFGVNKRIKIRMGMSSGEIYAIERFLNEITELPCIVVRR